VGGKRRSKLNRSRESHKERTTNEPDGAKLGHTLKISENEREEEGRSEGVVSLSALNTPSEKLR